MRRLSLLRLAFSSPCLLNQAIQLVQTGNDMSVLEEAVKLSPHTVVQLLCELLVQKSQRLWYFTRRGWEARAEVGVAACLEDVGDRVGIELLKCCCSRTGG